MPKIHQNTSLFQGLPTPEQYSYFQKGVYESYAFMHGHLFALPNDNAIAPAMKNGTYEHCSVEQMKKILLPGDIVIDVGACIGLYSVIASEIVGMSGKVVAIEPEKSNFDILKWNLDANNVKNIEIISMAMSDVRGTLYLEPGDGNAGDYRLSYNSKHPSVSVAAIDDIVVKDSPVNFIKIDAQGNEVRILRGAKKTIKRQNRIYMLIEFCPQAIKYNGDSIDEFIDLLFKEFKMRVFTFNYKEVVIISPKTVDFSKGYELLPVSEEWLKSVGDKEANSGIYGDLWCCKS